MLHRNTLSIPMSTRRNCKTHVNSLKNVLWQPICRFINLLWFSLKFSEYRRRNTLSTRLALVRKMYVRTRRHFTASRGAHMSSCDGQQLFVDIATPGACAHREMPWLARYYYILITIVLSLFSARGLFNRFWGPRPMPAAIVRRQLRISSVVLHHPTFRVQCDSNNLC